MMKDLKLIGKWWIPSNPNKQIGGVLTSTKNSNPTLNLESSFWDDPWAKVSEPLCILVLLAICRFLKPIPEAL